MKLRKLGVSFVRSAGTPFLIGLLANEHCYLHSLQISMGTRSRLKFFYVFAHGARRVHFLASNWWYQPVRIAPVRGASW